jgi:hypothetical protein
MRNCAEDKTEYWVFTETGRKLYKVWTNGTLCGQLGLFVDKKSYSKYLRGEEVRPCGVRKCLDENETSVCLTVRNTLTEACSVH